MTAVPRLTTHVLDIAAGMPAAGVRVELHRLRDERTFRVADVRTNADGRCDAALLEGAGLEKGHYALTFHVADYFRNRQVPLADPPFLESIVIWFGIADAHRSYHVPLLVSPWSYSTYRGS